MQWCESGLEHLLDLEVDPDAEAKPQVILGYYITRTYHLCKGGFEPYLSSAAQEPRRAPRPARGDGSGRADGGGGQAARGLGVARRGAGRLRSHCRFALPFIHFIPDALRDSAVVCVKRQCDRTLGGGRRGGGARAGAGLTGRRGAAAQVGARAALHDAGGRAGGQGGGAFLSSPSLPATALFYRTFHTTTIQLSWPGNFCN